MKRLYFLKANWVIMLFLLNLSLCVWAQEKPLEVAGVFTLTNKGISTIPSLTLGKPAMMFDFSIARNRLSFDPQFRFGTNGKPWVFLFWGRYKLAKTPKWFVLTGVHPAFSFRNQTFTQNEVSKAVTTVSRYLAGDFSANYAASKKLSLGFYYLYSHGVEKELTQHTHFIKLNTHFTHIKLNETYFLRANPQVYYLKMDAKTGIYFTATSTLAKKGSPLSLVMLVNKPFQTTVTPHKDLLWNLSLVYAFSKQYEKLP